MRPYLAFISAQHQRLALPDPTSSSLVRSDRLGFVASDAVRRSCAPPRASPYPTTAVLFCLESALHPFTSRETVVVWASVVVGFLTCARLSSIYALNKQYVVLETESVNFQLRVFKYG